MKRKMLSTKNSTSWPWSRKCSATVRPVRPTRARAPGGSFIWPNTSAHFEPSPPPSVVDAGFDELVIEVVAFAGALADAGEHRITAVRLRDVVDQFLNQHGLADAGAAEQADLAALGIRREQIDDLDAGDENFSLGRLLGIGRRFLMDGAVAFGFTGPASSTGSPMTFMMRPSVPTPTGTMIGAAGVDDFLAADQTFGGVHRDGAHGRSHRDAARLRAPGGCRRSWSRCAFRIAGRWPSNCTSTTAPMTWVMRPVWLAV